MDKAKTGSAAAPEKKISKMEAVRRAIAKFGPETKPTEIAIFIKKSFGIELTNDRISNYKSEILRQAGTKGKATKGKPGPKPMAKPASAPAPTAAMVMAPAASTNGKSTGGIGLKDIETVKELISRVGQKQLEGLIGLIAD